MPGSSVEKPNPVALLPLPDWADLSEQQVRGKTCVWDGALLDSSTAVDLGSRRLKLSDGHITMFPRACRPCVATHAHRTLHNHAPTCESCVDNAAKCDTGRALYQLIRDHRR